MVDIEEIVLKTKLGVTFKIAVDHKAQDAVTQSLRLGDFFSNLALDLLFSGVERQSRVLDLGAHIGTFSVAAAALGYDVIAVEASPRNVELLQASIRMNGFINLQVVSAAISDHVGTTLFFENGPFGVVNTPRFSPSQSLQVPTTTVDKMLEQLSGNQKVSFIKMDIEGSEFAAVQGMANLIATDAPPIFYESNGHTLYLFDKTPQMLIAELRRYGYQSYLAEPQRLIPLDENYVQYACVIDNLATKEFRRGWQGWLANKVTTSAQIQQIVSAANASSAERIHLARTLKHAPPDILREPSVQNVLTKLKTEGDPELNQAMIWFSATTK